VKTISLKKVSAVAVASLGFGLLSVVPANSTDFATTDLFYCKTALSGSTANNAASTAACTTLADNASTIVIGTRADADIGTSKYFVKVTAGSIAGISADVAEAGAVDAVDTDWGGLTDADGFATFVATDGADNGNATAGVANDGVTITIKAPSATATGKVEVYTQANNGVMTLVETHSIAFVASNTRDLTSIQVTTLPGNDADDCTVANKANADHNSITYDEAADQTNGDADSVDLCVLALDGNGAAKTGVNITVVVDGVGLIGGAAVASSAADADGIYQGNITGSLVAGTGKFNVTVTSTSVDGVTVISKTGSATVTFGDSKAASVVLTQTVGALDEGAAATTVATYTIKDGKGAVIAGGATGNLLADSDVASTTVIDVAGEEDATAAVAVGTAATVTTLGAQTANTGTITVDCAATTYEKITIWMHLESNTVASNKIVVFCTQAIGDVTTETVSVEAVNATAGGKQTVKATVLAGLTGFASYPVADIAAGGAGGVVFTSSGGTFATSAPAVVGGVASSDFFASAVTGDYTVVATAGGATGSKTFSVSGGVDTKALATQIDALNAKIVALNALIAKIMKKLGVK